MSPSIDYQEPPPPSPGRSAATWLLLLAIWTIGTLMCMTQFALIGWVILRIL